MTIPIYLSHLILSGKPCRVFLCNAAIMEVECRLCMYKYDELLGPVLVAPLK